MNVYGLVEFHKRLDHANLKIKDSDLDQIKLNRNEVKLYLEGEELDTTLTEIKNGYIYYDVSAEKMGEFVIGKAEAVEEVVVEKVVEQPKEVIPEVVKESEVQESTALPLTGEAVEDTEEGGFFNWFKNIFS